LQEYLLPGDRDRPGLHDPLHGPPVCHAAGRAGRGGPGHLAAGTPGVPARLVAEGGLRRRDADRDAALRGVRPRGRVRLHDGPRPAARPEAAAQTLPLTGRGMAALPPSSRPPGTCPTDRQRLAQPVGTAGESVTASRLFGPAFTAREDRFTPSLD